MSEISVLGANNQNQFRVKIQLVYNPQIQDKKYRCFSWQRHSNDWYDTSFIKKIMFRQTSETRPHTLSMPYPSAFGEKSALSKSHTDGKYIQSKLGPRCHFSEGKNKS